MSDERAPFSMQPPVEYDPALDSAGVYRDVQPHTLAADGLVGAVRGYEGYPEGWGAADNEDAAAFLQQVVPNDERIDY